MESTDDLCKRYNAGGKNLAHRKFELVPDGEPETAAPTSGTVYVWDKSRETIDQFIERTKAEAEAAAY